MKEVLVTWLYVCSLCILIMPSSAKSSAKTVSLPKFQAVKVSKNNVLMIIHIQRHYKMGQAIPVSVTIKNLRTIGIVCDDTIPYGLSVISLKQTIHGAKYDVPLTEFGQRYDPLDPLNAVRRLSPVGVLPGATQTIVIDLNRLYKLKANGTYEVTIGRGIDNLREDSFLIQNEPIQFEIDPSAKT